MTKLKVISPEIGQRVAGALLFAGAIVGVGSALEGADQLDNNVVVHFGEARPSDATSQAFDKGMQAAELVGLVAIGAQGVAMVRRSRNDQQRARHELASRINRRGVVAPLTLAAGVTVGALIGIQNGIEDAQTGVIENSLAEFGVQGEPFVLSNSDTPQSLSASTFPSELVRPFLRAADKEGVDVIPIRFAWQTAKKPDAASVQVFTASLPQEVTGLPHADEQCQFVPAAVAEEIGVQQGEAFDLEGLNVTVERVIYGGAGMNLLPIIFNDEDYARCLRADPNMPYSAILAEGDRAKIQAILDEISVMTDTETDIADRIYVVPGKDFLQNTEDTVKSNVDGLVLEAIMLAAIFAGGALSNDARTELASNRRNNMFLVANGLSWKELKSMYESKSRERALVSSLVAAPLIVLVDGASNLSMAGASMGPNAHTILSVIGLTYGTSKIGTVIAIRREKKAASGDEEHAL